MAVHRVKSYYNRTQIIDYIDSYNYKYKDELYKDFDKGIDNPLNPYKPRGLLIIGRYKKVESKKLRQLNSFLNNISIITYDEFLLNAESMLDFIEKRKSLSIFRINRR